MAGAAKYQPYPAYKPSGVEWLGDIPEGWEAQRNKTALQLRRSKVGKASKDFQLLSLTLKGVITRDISDGAGKIPAEFDTYQQVSVSDLVFCLFDIDETPRTVGISHNNGMITGAYNVYQCAGQNDPNFFCYYFLHLDSFKGLRPFYTGLRKVVRTETFGNISVPAPPLSDQTKIAAFLDYETAKIDALIAKQQRLIALLEEKRQAVISHAVTKGLDPITPLRPSGIDWLGDVPAHWPISSLKFQTEEMQTGPFGSQLHSGDYVSNGTPLINPAHMVNGAIIPDAEVSVDEATLKRLSRHKLREGELILARRGELGRCAIVTLKEVGWLCGTGSLKATLKHSLIPDYAFLLITSKGVTSEMSLESKGSTMENLNTETLGKIRLPIPPLDEQLEILSEVELVASKYDALVGKAVATSLLLKERRTALISAAVTGKIDLRGWQAPSEASDSIQDAEVLA